MEVVAEGIETPAAWALVADLGCELVQGYGLARPLSAKDSLPWLLTAGTGARPGPARPPVGSPDAVTASTTAPLR